MDRGALVGPSLKGLPRGDLQQSLGLLSMVAPPVAGDVLGLLADGMGYAKDPSSLTPAAGLLSLAGVIPGVPSGLSKIKPELAGRAADFAYGSADEMDDFLYHITTEPNAKKILKEGFKGGSGKSLFGGGYAGHSKGKVFLTDKGSVGYWRDRIEEGLDNSMDNPPPLVVLKIPRGAVGELFPDEAAGVAASSYWFKP